MKSLAEIVEQIKKDRDIAEEPAVSFSADSGEAGSPFQLIKDFTHKYPTKVNNVLENLLESPECSIFEEGEDFTQYFTDDEKFSELKRLRQDDPDKFYTIIRLYELYLNSILRLTGKSDAIIHFNIDDLF